MSWMRLWLSLALAVLALSLLLSRAHPEPVATVSGDADRGKAVFEKRCIGCHALDQDREGPRLGGVYGRVSGTVSGFAYSDGLKKAHLVWTEKTLDQWLTDPDTLVPDNNMDFHVPRADERRDLIAFLRKSSGQ